ncbi:sialate O-acetylesterase [Cyclobacterium qasimii]|uniref:Acetyl xylan esterase A n=2 Tax=Cyclobacterium qasimii TaxID=1350429 RepID=S7VK89_9BACT|nr:sialate O-acetylesterase [Cyclobacterium qasimii]EPR69932.1 acetyl xylan esterase A [Cyclobacterium qasimii M12-11B]
MSALLKKLVFLVFLLPIASFLQAQEMHNLDIYLAIGQSNMAGRAEILPDLMTPIEDVYLFTGQEWVPATNPLNLYSSVRKVVSMQRLGPVYGFARKMQRDIPDRKIGLVVNAKGGSVIAEWMPGTLFFNEIISRARIAAESGEIKGIIWHQGEGDVKEADQYLGKIGHLITAIRDSLNLPDLPFVVGQLSEDKEIRKPLNAYLVDLPKEMSNTGVALAYGTTTFDSTHFDSPSQILIGERYATEMKNLLTAKTQTDDFSFGVLTDIQYADVETVGKRNYRGTLETLKRTIPFLNAYDLEFSFHLGDLIDRDFESFDAPLSILESSKAPFHYIWGNHDFSVLDSLKQKVGEKIDNEKGYYSIEKGNMVFMVVNGMDISVGGHPEGTKNYDQALEMMEVMETEGANNVKPWNGAVGEEQLAWMESVVQKAEEEGKHVIAFCHYPLLPENGLHLLNHKEVMNRIGESPAMVAWFSGHHHAGNYFKDANGMHHLTFLGMVEAESPALGAIVTVKKDYLIIQGIGKEEDRILNFR